ncbi:hypothetical protein CEXT_347151 [Caerostris extrusa]|uniref:Uncharacterized protein n=1 Tax=Caerostris extrusa TaxID=172846 RepID=A0AAV4VDU2_CAEEX|nr:hypothetical protein CEXT_347151 [Caerostris extrusa]
MSFAVLILFIEVGLAVFTAVTFYMENSTELAYSISIAMKVTQIGLWFLSIVIVADCLQNRTSRTIDSMSHKLKKLKESRIIYDNLDYKRMESDSNEETRKNLKGFLIFEDEEGILQLDWTTIESEFRVNEIRWKFSPPCSPWWGGGYEKAARKTTGKISRKRWNHQKCEMRTEKGNILRAIQRLYPLEQTPNYEQVVPETQKVPEVVTEYPELNTDSNETVPVSRSGREIKPAKGLGF